MVMKNIILWLTAALLTLSVADTALAQEKGQKVDLHLLKSGGFAGYVARVANTDPIPAGWVDLSRWFSSGQTCDLSYAAEFEVVGFDQKEKQILLMVASYPNNPYGLQRRSAECPLGAVFFIPQEVYLEGVKRERQREEERLANHLAKQKEAKEEARKTQDSVWRSLNTDPDKK